METIILSQPTPTANWIVAVFVGLCMAGFLTFVIHVEAEKTARPWFTAFALAASIGVTLWLGNLDRQLSVMISDDTITVTHLHGPAEVIATKHVVEIEELRSDTKDRSMHLTVRTDQKRSIVFLGHRPEIASAIGRRAGLHEISTKLIHWVK